MTQIKTKPAFDLVYEIGKKIETQQFLFGCRGDFSSSITDNILFLTEGNLLELDTPKVAKKVYYLMVEGLQNITRHQKKDESGSAYHGGLFIINRKEQAYSITYGNWVSAAIKDDLDRRLNDIISKDSVELKETYLQVLSNSEFSSKGGAGLGLLDMARKSSGKIQFEFKPADEGFFYYLNLNIAIDKNNYDEELAQTYIKDAIALHKQMIDCDSQILFKGLLNESNVNHLSNQIDTTLSVDSNGGLGAVMTELLRNVAKHAFSRLNYVGKPGVFMLRKTENGYSMLTGNFIDPEKTQMVDSSIKSINSMDSDELESILEEANRTNKGSGLVQLRQISGHQFDYEILQINETPPYFILKIQLKQ